MAIIDTIKGLPKRIFSPDPPGVVPGAPPYNGPKGIPGNVQRVLDETAADAGKKVWSAMVHSIGSGIGKGIVIAAAIVIIGSGFAALAEGGFAFGAAAGLGSLFAGGASTAFLGIGALLGAIMEIHQNQNKITAEVAKAEAVAFESIRKQNQPITAQDLPAFEFAAREVAKRNAAQPQNLAK